MTQNMKESEISLDSACTAPHLTESPPPTINEFIVLDKAQGRQAEWMAGSERALLMMTEYKQLEVNIISAQDLKNPIIMFGRMRTYATAWIHLDTKLSTQIDRTGGPNPTWNDKIIFRVEEPFLRSETSALMVEIYCIGFVRDILVGTVRVLLSNLLKGYNGSNFTALQVRRPSGRPQGILNMGIVIHDGNLLKISAIKKNIGYEDLMGKNLQRTGPDSNKKIRGSTEQKNPKKKVRELKAVKLQQNPGNEEFKQPRNSVSKTAQRLLSDTARLKVESKNIYRTDDLKNTKPRVKKVTVACRYPLFGLNLRRKSRGKVNASSRINGNAKIHLSPSDNNISEKLSIPSMDHKPAKRSPLILSSA
eukprot:Gb_29632 [translate_table: standard]